MVLSNNCYLLGEARREAKRNFGALSGGTRARAHQLGTCKLSAHKSLNMQMDVIQTN